MYLKLSFHVNNKKDHEVTKCKHQTVPNYKTHMHAHVRARTYIYMHA
jgi:hypothetical protein